MPRPPAAAPVLAIVLLLAPPDGAGAQDADIERGRILFQSCRQCHSLQAGQSRLGPSLYGIFGRTAGTQPEFPNYSPSLRQSGVVWTDETMDRFVADPVGFIPGTLMTVPGLPDPAARRDLLAYMHEATGGAAAPAAPEGGTEETAPPAPAGGG